jgi:hypothetical protein
MASREPVSIGLQVLNTFSGDTNNSTQVQLGDVLSDDAESQAAQWFQHVGFASKPSAPIPGTSATETVAVRDTQRDAVVASRDIVSQENASNLSDGETMLYGAGSDGTAQGRVIIKQDGSVSLYTTDTNDKSGNGVYLSITPTALEFIAPWGKLIFDATGFHVKTQAGASMDLGALNFPAVPSLSNFARITAGNVTLDSSAVMLGPSAAGVYSAAAYAITPPPSPGVPLPMFTTSGSTSVFVGV